MSKELSRIPSIAEINDLVELAKRDRNQYIAERLAALALKLNKAIRTLFQSATATTKPSPMH